MDARHVFTTSHINAPFGADEHEQSLHYTQKG